MAGVLANDLQAVMENGFFQGYNAITWIIVCLQVCTCTFCPFKLGLQHAISRRLGDS
jgi:hypothetical protein